MKPLHLLEWASLVPKNGDILWFSERNDQWISLVTFEMHFGGGDKIDHPP